MLNPSADSMSSIALAVVGSSSISRTRMDQSLLAITPERLLPWQRSAPFINHMSYEHERLIFD
jgi:hypothetical protein